MVNKKIKIAILGASGYLGGELLRLLLPKKELELTAAVSGSQAGKRLDELHPHLSGWTDLKFSEATPAELAAKNDALFFALPHGVSQDSVAAAYAASETCKLFDLSGDFRISSASTYEKYYKTAHKHPQLLSQAVYGLPELKGQREKIKKAKLIASPGCFSTTSILAIAPFANAGLIDATHPIVVDAATGSSGSGTHPSANTHHPTRAHDFRAYEIFTHRHTPEIEEYGLRGGKGTKETPSSVLFTPHSGPWVRGIFATAYIPLKKEMTSEEAMALLKRHYAGERFVQVVGQAHVAQVAYTNNIQISAAARGKTAIVTAALDNLVKGGAGQAVQSFNLAFGLDEKSGLDMPGYHP